ncbi:MFS general substrate transporter [Paraphaeosphaeria sporulosa]|uniref:MFS general substrate transporter n=1 Tax=Paraphaeosphaeria sporulosa TaxID=1460663 RepID=A0A177C4G3_9PLEO|nr:MFS general substrate transporter [Paraphaeosphaeria sporulosa]OAG01772.1 MFS general substrate transporter [Paraphaeosphaeria sporulosa]
MQDSEKKENALGYSIDVSVGGSQDSIQTVQKEPIVRQDGGTRAWLQVMGCWLLFMNTWGLTNSFSIFETYYNQKFQHISHSNISWIGSMQLFLTLFVGVFAGWLLDRGHLRIVLVTGIAFEVVGIAMTSLCTTYWHLLLAQGVCVGIGSGTLAFTSAAIIPFYFAKRRMLAAGIVSTGSSVAGVVYPLMMRELFDKVGFAWAVRVLALVMLGGLSMSLVILRPHSSARKERALLRSDLLRDAPYTIFIVSYAFMVAGVYVPYFFIQSYALDLSIDESMTFNVVAIMNAATFFGRFPYNYLADIYGGIAVLVPCCFATSIILFFWRFVHTLGGLIAISATFCFVTGGLVSLPAVTIANLTEDKSEYGTRMGMGYTIAAIGALLGNPIAGLARDSDSIDVLERWQGAWFVAGGALLVATALMIWARVLRAGVNMSVKI